MVPLGGSGVNTRPRDRRRPDRRRLFVRLVNALGFRQTLSQDPISCAVVVAPTLVRAFAKWRSAFERVESAWIGPARPHEESVRSAARRSWLADWATPCPAPQPAPGSPGTMNGVERR